MDWLSRLLDVHRLPFKIVLWVAVVSGVLVFAPNGFVQQLALADFMKAYRAHIGVISLASGALVAINACAWLVAKARGKTAYWKWKSELASVLGSLDHAEKAVLREFYLHGKHTIELPMNNATVVGLRNKGIITLVGKYGEHSLAGMLFPFCISEEARNMITIDMLDLPTGEPSEQEIARLKASRPDFAREIQ
mgnify:CR=1 FL=1